MKAKDVRIGETYIAKVSGKMASVRITGTNSFGGWDGRNLATGRFIRIRSAQRLRGNLTVREAIRKQVDLGRSLSGDQDVKDAEAGWSQRQKDNEAMADDDSRSYGPAGPPRGNDQFRR